MKSLLSTIIFCMAIFIFWAGCKKETESFNSPSLNSYYPLQVGKIFIYRLDSTVTFSFGSRLVVHSYQARDSVESMFTDQQGRPTYRIFRSIRDTLGKQPWTFAATYTATQTPNTIEYVDNNMRFLKLHLPIIDGYTWKAHSYIDTKSLNSTVTYLDEWEYEYKNYGQPTTIRNKTFDSTVTVFQHDETSPPGPFDPNNYQQRNYGLEIYAKGVGLIYKEFLHWTYQTTPPPPKYEDGSYGVKLQLINYY